MKPISSESRILAPFLAALIVFSGAAALYMQNAAGLLDAVAAQSHLTRVRSQAEATVTALAEAETAHRDFLLTGMPYYRQRHESGLADADRHLRALGQLMADDAEDGRRLHSIRALKDARQRRLAAALDDRARLDAAAAAASLLTGSDSAGLDGLRAQFNALQMALDSREARLQESLAASRIALWQRLAVLMTLMGLMLAAAIWVLFRTLRARSVLAERLQYESTHDNLTGLPNRRFFTQWMERSLAQARREQRKLALLCLDLDGFRRINDERGQEIGDRLLRVAARRFRDTLRESDVLARVGADEFAILTPATATPENVVVLAQRLIDSLAEPLLPQFGKNCVVGVSIGISLYPADGATSDQLMHAAALALQAARQNGTNHYRLATDATEAATTE
jgi:diguanylate cyclase (GGDEF)-like protein